MANSSNYFWLRTALFCLLFSCVRIASYIIEHDYAVDDRSTSSSEEIETASGAHAVFTIDGDYQRAAGFRVAVQARKSFRLDHVLVQVMPAGVILYERGQIEPCIADGRILQAKKSCFLYFSAVDGHTNATLGTKTAIISIELRQSRDSDPLADGDVASSLVAMATIRATRKTGVLFAGPGNCGETQLTNKLAWFDGETIEAFASRNKLTNDYEDHGMKSISMFESNVVFGGNFHFRNPHQRQRHTDPYSAKCSNIGQWNGNQFLPLREQEDCEYGAGLQYVAVTPTDASPFAMGSFSAPCYRAAKFSQAEKTCRDLPGLEARRAVDVGAACGTKLVFHTTDGDLKVYDLETQLTRTIAEELEVNAIVCDGPHAFIAGRNMRISDRRANLVKVYLANATALAFPKTGPLAKEVSAITVANGYIYGATAGAGGGIFAIQRDGNGAGSPRLLAQGLKPHGQSIAKIHTLAQYKEALFIGGHFSHLGKRTHNVALLKFSPDGADDPEVLPVAEGCAGGPVQASAVISTVNVEMISGS